MAARIILHNSSFVALDDATTNFTKEFLTGWKNGVNDF